MRTLKRRARSVDYRRVSDAAARAVLDIADAGYEVVAVSNGAQAVKKIAEHKPGLAILDVYMPGYSGLEVCERVKKAAETAAMPAICQIRHVRV